MGKGRPRKKTNLNIEQITNELLDVVSNVYFSNLESLLIKETGKDKSYKAVEMTAEQFDISPMKMRKLLITSGAYATSNSTWIKTLKDEGNSIDQICMITGLKKASVNGMLPYYKAVYKLEERSVGADRCRIHRQRKQALEVLREEICRFKLAINSENTKVFNYFVLDDLLWQALEAYSKYPFKTCKGMKYTYYIKGGELFVSRKDGKSITKSSILIAFHTALELQMKEGCVAGPKKLGTFGASYLYPIFLKWGIISRIKLSS